MVLSPSRLTAFNLIGKKNFCYGQKNKRKKTEQFLTNRKVPNDVSFCIEKLKEVLIFNEECFFIFLSRATFKLTLTFKSTKRFGSGDCSEKEK
jgi:hypothetical protein